MQFLTRQMQTVNCEYREYGMLMANQKQVFKIEASTQLNSTQLKEQKKQQLLTAQ